MVSSVDTHIEDAHMMSLTPKVWVGLVFSMQGQTNPFGKIYEGFLYIGELMIASYRGLGSFANPFSSNLNTTNLNIFIVISKELSLR